MMTYINPVRYAVACTLLILGACAQHAGDGSDTIRHEAAQTIERDTLVSQAEQDRRIDYIEFLTTNMSDTKEFYSDIFGWEFTDYGPDYSSFSDGRLAGGFTVASEVAAGSPLIVLYATNLGDIESKIREHGGQIVRETFEFPGGRRFHFTDPGGNELAVWSDQ